MKELTKLQKNILKQSDYELKEWLVDAYEELFSIKGVEVEFVD